MNRRKAQNRPKPAPKPAREPRQRVGLRAWREQHLYSLFSSLGRLATRPWATILTVLVMALALTLPLLFYLLLDNARQLHGDMRDAGTISVFLKPHLDATTVQAHARRLRGEAGVAAVRVRTPEQGLEEFRSQSGFAEALDVLRENPLPAVLLVTPADAGDGVPAALIGRLRGDADIDLVQYDAAWRERLDAILAAATRGAQLLAGLLALALLLVVGNTVRLDIAGRSDEIGVMQLLGASSGFVRRPFLYTGLWYGLLSALLATALALAVEALLAAPLQQLVASYDHRFDLRGLHAGAVAATIGVGALLGWLGAWLATWRHLARMRA
jgi:cell division transport system permease protein